jgi:hypothetical protein
MLAVQEKAKGTLGQTGLHLGNGHHVNSSAQVDEKRIARDERQALPIFEFSRFRERPLQVRAG